MRDQLQQDDESARSYPSLTKAERQKQRGNTYSDMGTGYIGIPIETARIRIRPVQSDDLPSLYKIAINDELVWRWRFNGTIPNFDGFVKLFNVGAFIQFVVTGSNDHSAVKGLVTGYNADLRGGTAYIAIMMGASALNTGLGMEAMCLFVNYLFSAWNLRKIYFESVEFNYWSMQSGEGKFFVKEGELRDYYYFNGRYWDEYICAIQRDQFLRHEAVRRLIGI